MKQAMYEGDLESVISRGAFSMPSVSPELDHRVRIGGLTIAGHAVLAPMSGVCDQPFRSLCRRAGAAAVYTEFVSSDGVVRKNRATRRMLEFAEDERPVVAQVFGSDPAVVYDAVQAIEDTGVDIIDVNFGCPVKKVVKREAGSALLKNPPLLASVMRAAADAARRVPVTAKIRSGWNSVNAVEIARILEGIGAAAIAVHARTQSMGYSGNADWQVIADVKNALQIPVIGNGDVFTPQAAREMIDRTGCDLVMVARGAQGAPWLFAQINAEFRRLPIPRVTWHERIRVAAAHLALSLRQRPAIVAVRLFRSHIAHYTKGAPESAAFRGRVFCIDDAETVLIHLEEYAGFLERETPETSGSDCDKVFPASEAIPVATECHDDP